MLGCRAVRLADLIGQDTARTALLRAIERGHLAHAYLFEGPRGVGKRGAALRPGDGAQLRDGAGRGLRRLRDLPAHRRRHAPRRPDVRSVGTGRADRHRRRARRSQALARTRPHEARGARDRHRRRRRDEPERRQLPPQDAGGAARAQPPGAVHERARSPAADHPLARAARPLPPAARRAAAGAGAAANGIPDARAEIAAALADGSAARLFALAAEDDDGAAAQTLAALRAAVVGADHRARVRLRGGPGAATRPARRARTTSGKLLDLTARLYRDAIALAAGAPELAVLRDSEGRDAAALARAGRRAPEPRARPRSSSAQEALLANVNPTLAIERLLIALKRQERRAALTANQIRRRRGAWCALHQRILERARDRCLIVRAAAKPRRISLAADRRTAVGGNVARKLLDARRADVVVNLRGLGEPFLVSISPSRSVVFRPLNVDRGLGPRCSRGESRRSARSTRSCHVRLGPSSTATRQVRRRSCAQ